MQVWMASTCLAGSSGICGTQKDCHNVENFRWASTAEDKEERQRYNNISCRGMKSESKKWARLLRIRKSGKDETISFTEDQKSKAVIALETGNIQKSKA